MAGFDQFWKISLHSGQIERFPAMPQLIQPIHHPDHAALCLTSHTYLPSLPRTSSAPRHHIAGPRTQSSLCALTGEPLSSPSPSSLSACPLPVRPPLPFSLRAAGERERERERERSLPCWSSRPSRSMSTSPPDLDPDPALGAGDAERWRSLSSLRGGEGERTTRRSSRRSS